MALGELRDEQARVRVMRWAMERFIPAFTAFAPDPAARAQPQSVAEVATGPDGTLEVCDLDEFFVDDTVHHPHVERMRAVGTRPLESVVKGFGADFRRVAAERKAV
jgi:hypothetical protein